MTISTDIPAMTGDQVNFPAGAKRTHRINVVDSAEAAQAMTGWSLAYIWRDAAGRAVLTKTTGAGVTIGNGTATDDRATVAIDAANTEGFAGEYDAALWRTDSTNDDPLWVGKIVVTPVARQP